MIKNNEDKSDMDKVVLLRDIKRILPSSFKGGSLSKIIEKAIKSKSDDSLETFLTNKQVVKLLCKDNELFTDIGHILLG